MANLGIIFLTGLTTGGLSCLAVQGGLLASSVVPHVEQNTSYPPSAASIHTSARMQTNAGTTVTSTSQAAWAILLFLGAKLVAYTALGVLLGFLGTMLQLTPVMRAIFQGVIAVFMIGTALRMLHVHPIFRIFALQPPSAVTRYIRRTAKQSRGEAVTPVLLGTLTVLIPCGITQAMMALALGSGDPIAGATIMFAFTLGTTPVFFGLAYLAAHIGKRLERHFSIAIAAVILVLGLILFDGALNLLGVPLSFANVIGTQSSSAEIPAMPSAIGSNGARPSSAGQVTVSSTKTLTIMVQDNGYQPAVTQAVAGTPITLNLITYGTYGCPRAFVIPALNYQEILPETGTTTIQLPPQQVGSELRYTCSMGMYGGTIVFK